TLMKTKIEEKLGARELEIMQVLWNAQSVTVTEVQETLIANGSDIAYTTVQTILNRMETKGYVARDTADRAHRYQPLLKEPTAVPVAIKRLADQFFSGSVEALATHLVSKNLSKKQLDQIQKIIDEHRKKDTPK